MTRLMISKEKINQAGYYLIGKNSKLSKDESNSILEKFRSIHRHPMTLFRHTIERKLKKFNIKSPLVSQRLKRIPSIVKKLKIQKTMGLSRMQDIGGLRVVVNTIEEVNLIRDELKNVEKHRNFKFTFVNEKNYIEVILLESGYRSIHMIYKYDKGVVLEKQCRVEIQIRTKIQHSWATAVEVTGTYLNQPLKQSFGEQKYLDIFKNISKLFISLESKKIDYEFIKKIEKDVEEMQLLKKLQSFKIITNHLDKNAKGKYLLLKMNFKDNEIDIRQYSDARFEQANKDYLDMELDCLNNKAVEVVLLSIQDINKLKQSYPNYFMDTEEFIKNMNILFKLASQHESIEKTISSIKNKKSRKKAETMVKNITEKILKPFD
ncbi:RelA/SpoT domain protein [uncultured Candidatus Thioglobus sp.]|nr:RelA/SpoT domain protein [uncultured Candidatus Thioglobus sp.]